MHRHGEEVSNFFGIGMTKALKVYQEFNGNTLPKKIIVYRDGVGDGQIEYVKEVIRDDPPAIRLCWLSFVPSTRIESGLGNVNHQKRYGVPLR